MISTFDPILFFPEAIHNPRPKPKRIGNWSSLFPTINFQGDMLVFRGNKDIIAYALQSGYRHLDSAASSGKPKTGVLKATVPTSGGRLPEACFICPHTIWMDILKCLYLIFTFLSLT